ncbi:MAG TPA: c-type cytochrome domain-containing protein, partial [Pirellulaceae bacterium]|nr:c-type cytochrome domain-containing protein [Pirellulaceae bacterium]
MTHPTIVAAAFALWAATGFAADAIPIEAPLRSKPVDYAGEIAPLFRAHCVACHNEKKAEGSLNLETPAAMRRGGENGPAIVSGKGAESLLLKVAAHQQETFMPPADNAVGAVPLSPKELGVLKLWIDQGATGAAGARSVSFQPPAAGYQPILAVAVTPDGQYAAASRGNQIHVYHLPTAKLVAKLVDPALGEAAHQDIVRCLVFGATGELLASGGFREVKLWRRPKLTPLAGEGEAPPAEADATTAKSPDGKTVATIVDGKAQLQDEDGKLLFELAPDPRLLDQLRLLDAQIAFTKSAIELAKQDIKAYEGPQRRTMTTAEEVKKAEMEVMKAEKTRDEKLAALEKAKADSKNVENAEKAAEDAKTAVNVAMTVVERAKAVAERAVKKLAEAEQDVTAREERLKSLDADKTALQEKIKNAPASARSVAFWGEGRFVAIGTDEGAIHTYLAETGQPTETLVTGSGAVRALECAGNTLIATANEKRLRLDADPTWRLVRTIGGAAEPALLVDRVLTVDFSPDGKLLATGGGVPSRSGELKIWNTTDGQLVREFAAPHADTVNAVRFAPDGQQLASAGADRMVKVFDAADGELLKVMGGHTAAVTSLAWHSGGKQLVSAGSDQLLKQWDAETGLPTSTLKGTTYQIGAYKREVSAAAFVGDSEQFVAASGDGTVRLHRTTSDND